MIGDERFEKAFASALDRQMMAQIQECFQEPPSLSTCPFCGSDAEYMRVGLVGYAVRCKNIACRAEQTVYRSRQDAALHWNRRVWNEK